MCNRDQQALNCPKRKCAVPRRPDPVPAIWLPRPPSPSEPPSRLRHHLPLYSPPATPKVLPHRVHPPTSLVPASSPCPPPEITSPTQPRPLPSKPKSSPRFPPRQASNCLRSQRFHTASSRPLQPQHPRVASPPDRISWPSHLRILRIRLARGVFFPIPSLVLIQEPRIRQSAAQHRPVLPRPEPCALSEPRAAPSRTTRSPHPPPFLLSRSPWAAQANLSLSSTSASPVGHPLMTQFLKTRTSIPRYPFDFLASTPWSTSPSRKAPDACYSRRSSGTRTASFGSTLATTTFWVSNTSTPSTSMSLLRSVFAPPSWCANAQRQLSPSCFAPLVSTARTISTILAAPRFPSPPPPPFTHSATCSRPLACSPPLARIVHLQHTWPSSVSLWTPPQWRCQSPPTVSPSSSINAALFSASTPSPAASCNHCWESCPSSQPAFVPPEFSCPAFTPRFAHTAPIDSASSPLTTNQTYAGGATFSQLTTASPWSRPAPGSTILSFCLPTLAPRVPARISRGNIATAPFQATSCSATGMTSTSWSSSPSWSPWKSGDPPSTDLRFIVKCDNAKSVCALNSGRSRTRAMQLCLREIWFLSARFDFVLFADHLPGTFNTLVDYLSRWHLSPTHKAQLQTLTAGLVTQNPLPRGAFRLWSWVVISSPQDHPLSRLPPTFLRPFPYSGASWRTCNSRLTHPERRPMVLVSRCFLLLLAKVQSHRPYRHLIWSSAAPNTWWHQVYSNRGSAAHKVVENPPTQRRPSVSPSTVHPRLSSVPGIGSPALLYDSSSSCWGALLLPSQGPTPPAPHLCSLLSFPEASHFPSWHGSPRLLATQLPPRGRHFCLPERRPRPPDPATRRLAFGRLSGLHISPPLNPLPSRGHHGLRARFPRRHLQDCVSFYGSGRITVVN